MNSRVHLLPRALVAAIALLAACCGTALAAFPYQPQGAATDYGKYRLPASQPVPNDLTDKRIWMYASTPPAPRDFPPGPLPDIPSPLIADKRELGGVRGAWVVDQDRAAPQAWHTTTGRPDVTIAVLDSGIMWNSGDMLRDIRKVTRISQGEARKPAPSASAATTEPGESCVAHANRSGQWDVNGDGVFNVVDYACDPQVPADPPKGVGPKHGTGAAALDPQDVLIASTNGVDDDGNGYVDDVVGWDFLDDDNDPFDDVQYGHGTGEAKDSAGEANTGGDLGTCPNCMEIHLRVGTSFVADVNRFAEATIYATDNDVDVVQEALGTLNKSRLAADAVKYAYDHGTTVIASAADEAAQHHNWPSSYPYSIVVNSVTHFDEGDAVTDLSYLQFNGCTNFSSRITLAIPSVSCSSDATGRGAGMAGLIYSAALNAVESGQLERHPACVRTDGTKCPITPNEVRQIMASGIFGAEPAADDVNFAVDPVLGTDTDQLNCGNSAAAGCTDPFRSGVLDRQFSVPKTYPARRGHDQFYGYGRVNMNRAVDALQPGGETDTVADDVPSRIPPEVELTSPAWYEMVSPDDSSLRVRGQVWARGRTFACRVFVAPGSYPKDISADGTDLGDFVEVSRGECDGQSRSSRVDGLIADIAVDDLEALFPEDAGDFHGPETGAAAQTPNPTGNVGRPNDEPYGFTVKVLAKTTGQLTGEDRRQAYLHRDQHMLPGFPKQLAGDVEASPVLADLDGDNRNEMVVANSDGEVHAFRRDGSELPGYPVLTDPLPAHPGATAYESGRVKLGHGAVLGTPAVGDLDHDGTLEIVVADLEDKVYVFDGETGARERMIRTPLQYTGAPLKPYENVRQGDMNRTQHGFLASPVLADLDRDDGGRLEIIAASMDRHVYAFNHDGSDVPGWPVLVVDRAKVQSIDPVTHRVAFKQDDLMQGAIIDTPAVGDIAGDERPEVIVGTNEEYADENDGGLNAGGLSQALYAPLGSALNPANGRLYAIKPEGEPGGPKPGSGPYVEGWPFKVGILQGEILPLVGEGITGAPVLGDVPCNGPGATRVAGVIPAAGVPYLVGANGQSCYGRQNGLDVGLPTEGGKASDQVFLAAFGHPAFGTLSTGSVFLAPAAGVVRAVDVVAPEYQGGQDYLVAWGTAQGTIQPSWPAEMNDLQFLTGPTVGDLVPGKLGDEVIAASAHHDLQAFDAAAADADASWPKLTGDWSVANPALGTFGERETDAAARKVVLHGTRNGRLLGYSTGAAACAPASWPKFHHDLANSGDTRRDAIPPGAVENASMAGTKLTFTQPGDDLLCGTATRFEIRTASTPLTAANFAGAGAVPYEAAAGAPGTQVSIDLPADRLRRYVGVRAVDETGAVGRFAAVDLGEGFGAGGGGGADPGTTPPPGGKPAPKPITKPPARRRCAARSLRLKTSGLGSFRLGRTAKRLEQVAGRPVKVRKRARNWCVTSGGSVRVMFDGRGRAVAVASTAKRHRVGKIARGSKLSKLRRAYPKLRRVRKGIYVSRRGSRIVFGVRSGRVRYVAVGSKSVARSAKSLRRHLHYAGF
jgi:hypothetical protein